MLAQGTAPAGKAGARAARNDAKGHFREERARYTHDESVKTGGRKAARTIREGTKKGRCDAITTPKGRKDSTPHDIFIRHPIAHNVFFTHYLIHYPR